MVACDNYCGKLFRKIGIGTTVEEMLNIEPSFRYDEFEEVWESEKGVFIETDGKTNRVRWITVYIPELLTNEFDKCRW